MAAIETEQKVETRLLEDLPALRSRILDVLYRQYDSSALFQKEAWDRAISSTVMLLLGKQPVNPERADRSPFFGAAEAGLSAPSKNGGAPNQGDRPFLPVPGSGSEGAFCVPSSQPRGSRSEICIILNKRSERVRQPGDLCCPGGSLEPQLDPYLARLLRLPGLPLARWPYWSELRHSRPQESRLLSLLLATGLREGWEEMRLNPLCVQFMGALPFQKLLLFQRIVIHPMVGWISWQERFTPSWEVEKIIPIPLRSLLNPAHYARYRLYVPPHLEKRIHRGTQDFPCFLYPHEGQTERLWGATYRIVTIFIELVFGFKPPEMDTLPLVPGVLDEAYVNG